MKKTIAITVIATMLLAALSGCGCQKSSDNSTTSKAETSITEEVSTEPATVELNETEQAIAEQGLSVNEKGEIVDANGKKAETTSDGKVKVTTKDGKTVEVSPGEVKNTNAKTSSNTQNNPDSGKSSQTSSKASTASSSSKSKSSNTASNSGASKSTSTPKTDSGNTKQQSSNSNTRKSETSKTSSQTSKQSSQASDPHAGKTYHEAVYKTVNHPAETKQVKVVDQEAYSYEEPVYKLKKIHKCKDCGIDLLQLTSDERYSHAENHVLNGGDGGWHTAQEQVQVGTRTVDVPEKSHYETVVVKEAWTEKVLVKEAGWY